VRPCRGILAAAGFPLWPRVSALAGSGVRLLMEPTHVAVDSIDLIQQPVPVVGPFYAELSRGKFQRWLFRNGRAAERPAVDG
jgi:hypothetical protein